MRSLNYDLIGDPIAKVSTKMQSKQKKNSKNTIVHNMDQCPFCFKKTTPANRARHLKVCPVKKAGGGSKLISISTDGQNVKEPINEIKVGENEIVQQIPNKNKERSIYYISGQSGSGKSYYTNKLTEEYHSMFPKNSIYLFSFLTEDKSITNRKIKRIKLNEEFLQTQFSLDDFKDSLLIFDDVDSIKDKLLKDKLFNILDILLQCGRHSSSSVIYCSHLPCNGKDTRMILNECTSLTLFPANMNHRALKYVLGEYFGLDKKQIERIKKLDSRHITIARTFPLVLLHNKGAYILNSDEKE